MKKIIIIILILFFHMEINADDCIIKLKKSWQIYLNTNKNGTEIIELLNDNKCSNNIFSIVRERDFLTLNERIRQDDLIAFKITLDLLKYSKGAYTEALLSCTSNLINVNPYQFLLILKDYHFDNKEHEFQLKRILLNTGSELVDLFDKQTKEIANRINSLNTVNNNDLNQFKNQCLKILNDDLLNLTKTIEFIKISKTVKINKDFKVSVSSERFHKNNIYSYKSLIDGDKSTAWVAGGDSRGINETLIITLPERKYVKSIRIQNGLQKNNLFYYANNRIKKIKLNFNDTEAAIFLKDIMGWQSIPVDDKIKKIEITILDIIKGTTYPDDTCISELEIESE